MEQIDIKKHGDFHDLVSITIQERVPVTIASVIFLHNAGTVRWLGLTGAQ